METVSSKKHTFLPQILLQINGWGEATTWQEILDYVMQKSD